MKSGKIPAVAALLFFAALIFEADAAREGAKYGLSLAFCTAIPALFPFFAASSLLSQTGVLAALGRACARPMWRLYGLPGDAAGALVLGLTGGYPVGAAAVTDLHRDGRLDTAQASRLLGFCNNTGPAFIVGVCGAGVLGSVTTGLLLYAIHIAAALLVGLIMTHPGHGPAPIKRSPPRGSVPFSQALVTACEKAAHTSIQVAAFLTLFAVLAALAEQSGLLTGLAQLLAPVCTLTGMPEEAVWPLLYGALELTRGLAVLPEAALDSHFVLPVASALLAFGGLSVWCQSMSVIAGTRLSLARLALGKVLHALFAAALAALCGAAMPHVVPAFAPLEIQLPTVPVWGRWAVFVMILLTITYGKHRRHTV